MNTLSRFSIFLIGILFFLVSCKDNSSEFFMIAENSQNIRIDELRLDSIFLNIETSFTGIFKIRRDKLFFTDRRFCWVYEIDTNGKILSKNLGQGRGPNELNTGIVDFFEPLQDGRYFFMGASNDCHVHSVSWEREEISILENGVTVSNKSRLKQKTKIEADMKWVYTPCWDKLVTRNQNNYIYYNIQAKHPDFNAISKPKEYHMNGRIIAKVSLGNTKLVDILGRLSPVYQKYKYLPQFMLPSFDVTSKGEFYVCFEADPVIYYYDEKFKIKEAFGYEGKNMNTKYMELPTVQTAIREYNNQREKCGYYNWIEYIDERNLLFRSYIKGEGQKTDGLQIYENSVLISDLNVPKGFKVIGYITPYFYSDVIIDEISETIKVYKFKID